MMTNELLTREDFPPADARVSGRQAGQQLISLSVFIFNGSALISQLNILLIPKRYMWLIPTTTVR
jgi:hypothetical protein